MHVIDAARLVVRDYPGGAASLAPRLGKAASSLQHELDPNYAGAKLGLADAVTITQLTGDLRIVNAIAQDVNCMLIPLPEGGQGADCTLEAISAKAQRFATYLAQVTGAVADGVVTDNELQAVNAAYADLMLCGQQLQALMLALNQDAKPQHERRQGPGRRAGDRKGA